MLMINYASVERLGWRRRRSWICDTERNIVVLYVFSSLKINSASPQSFVSSHSLLTSQSQPTDPEIEALCIVSGRSTQAEAEASYPDLVQVVQFGLIINSLTGTKPNLSGLPEFGCEVWVHSTKGSKLDGRATKGRWVGYDEDSSSHHIYSLDKCTVSIQ